MKTNCLRSMVFSCLCLTLSAAALAQTLDELQSQDRLRIKVWIEPQEHIVARQQLNLQIEVATDKWFSGGTRIGHFEVKDAIVLQRENFAVNSTLKQADKTWIVQLWTLVVYPQRGGVFEMPAIPLRLSVAGDNNESIIGEVSTGAFRFVAKVPEPMVDKPGWLASNRFDLQESFNKGFDDLKPGDALIRTITLSADNLPAMMLPPVAQDAIAGIAVYPTPPQITDKVNRGDYLAERTEVITYVFEKPGDYLLPEQRFYWWDLVSQSAESIVLEARPLSVGGVANVGASDRPANSLEEAGRLQALIPVFIKAAAGLVFVLLVWFVVGRFKKHFVRVKRSNDLQLTEQALRKKFDQACARNQHERALGLLYQWLDNYAGNGFKGSVREQLAQINKSELSRLFSDVMRSIYMTGETEKIELKLFADKFTRELKKVNQSTTVRLAPVELRLN